MDEEKKHEQDDDHGKLEFKDIIAIMIAQLQILIPIALIGGLLFTMIFFILTKFWIRI